MALDAAGHRAGRVAAIGGWRSIRTRTGPCTPSTPTAPTAQRATYEMKDTNFTAYAAVGAYHH